MHTSRVSGVGGQALIYFQSNFSETFILAFPPWNIANVPCFKQKLFSYPIGCISCKQTWWYMPFNVCLISIKIAKW